MFEPSMLAWIGETEFNLLNGLRKFSYGLRGLPPQDYSLHLRGKHYSAIGIVTTEGTEDVFIMNINGS